MAINLLTINRTSRNFLSSKIFAILEMDFLRVRSIHLATLEDAGSIEGYRNFVKQVSESRYITLLLSIDLEFPGESEGRKTSDDSAHSSISK